MAPIEAMQRTNATPTRLALGSLARECAASLDFAPVCELYGFIRLTAPNGAPIRLLIRHQRPFVRLDVERHLRRFKKKSGHQAVQFHRFKSLSEVVLFQDAEI